MSKIHIAGFPVRIGNKGRQLCAWCGFILFDVDHSNVMVAPNEDGSVWSPSPWPVGQLISVSENVMTVIPHKDGDDIPLQCCACPPVNLKLVT